MPLLPEMTLPAPAVVPPIVLPAAVDIDPVAGVGQRGGAGGVGADRVAFRPARKPVDARRRCRSPSSMLPEITLRCRRGLVPPIVSFDAPS